MNFFKKYFKKILPTLFKHFKALDLRVEDYFFTWLLTLYSGCMNPSIVARIWDCFILEGETYAFKVGIGILKLFEVELKILNYHGILDFLKLLPDEIREDEFFDMVDDIRIPAYLYNQQLE